ncbi:MULTISPECIES: hypothetical protein [unclassified Marinobacter]|uniref:hypothetical protein n=1 Tax=unclassified Marinobacter TaxID=83889 RepID=UPI00200C9DAB|nr:MULTISPECIES: hypothetical protein [unclassified Marinobacter]MCL1483857.1 hypothetical protein [Marinobacter sp.]MCL1487293.1 hypothetical protein [Marinobacter sp.]UQG55519.1 hypothetical protein MIH16_19350 [Marinobacter sp. M4C]UQG64323.1 hypothetical protein MIH17_19345 [Marinobacter sp. M2C]UQG68602.1 hypothetical protein MIH19_19355 [Marinobacter sp. M1C]
MLRSLALIIPHPLWGRRAVTMTRGAKGNFQFHLNQKDEDQGNRQRANPSEQHRQASKDPFHG